MSREFDAAVEILLDDDIIAVAYGENGKGWDDLTLYLAGGGAVEITAEGRRDANRPFEHGAVLLVGFNPDAVYEDAVEDEPD